MTAFLQMRFVLRHWGLVRGIVILVAGTALVVATAMEVSSGRGWSKARPSLLVGTLVFSFSCYIPIFLDLSDRINSRLTGRQSPGTTWYQVILLWISVFGMATNSVEMIFPTGTSPFGEEYATIIGYCTSLGLFFGSGNFLAKEISRNPASLGGEGPQ